MEFRAKITREVNKGKLIAFADLVADDQLILRGAKLMRGENGMFLSMPDTEWKDRFGETHYTDTFAPANREVQGQMFRAVRDAYIAFEEAAAQTRTDVPGDGTGTGRKAAEPEAEQLFDDPSEDPFGGPETGIQRF